jgi:hypothetical protein
MFKQSGLLDVTVIPVTGVFTDVAQANELLIGEAPERAATGGWWIGTDDRGGQKPIVLSGSDKGSKPLVIQEMRGAGAVAARRCGSAPLPSTQSLDLGGNLDASGFSLDVRFNALRLLLGPRLDLVGPRRSAVSTRFIISCKLPGRMRFLASARRICTWYSAAAPRMH